MTTRLTADFADNGTSRAQWQTEEAWWATFGDAVRAARASRGLTQSQLGEILGLTRTSVANIEAARQHVSAYIAARMIAELGLTVPGWQADAAAVALAGQYMAARAALVDVLELLDRAQSAARKGLDRQ